MSTVFYSQAPPLQQQFSPGFYQTPYTQQHIVYQTPLTSTPQPYPYSSTLSATIPSSQLKYSTGSNNLSPYQYVVHPPNAKYVIDPSYNYILNNDQNIQYLVDQQQQQQHQQTLQPLSEYQQIPIQPQSQYTPHSQSHSLNIPSSQPSLTHPPLKQVFLVFL